MNDIDSAIASFHAAQTNAAALNALVESQAAQQRLVQQQLTAGAADRLDVLSALLELNAARLAQLDARVKLQMAIGALEDAIQRPME